MGSLKCPLCNAPIARDKEKTKIYSFELYPEDHRPSSGFPNLIPGRIYDNLEFDRRFIEMNQRFQEEMRRHFQEEIFKKKCVVIYFRSLEEREREILMADDM